MLQIMEGGCSMQQPANLLLYSVVKLQCNESRFPLEWNPFLPLYERSPPLYIASSKADSIWSWDLALLLIFSRKDCLSSGRLFPELSGTIQRRRCLGMNTAEEV